MAFSAITRYGSMERYDDNADIPSIVEFLLSELETEYYEIPDDEHTQVSIQHSNWSVSVCVSGLMILDDLRGITGSADDRAGPEMFKRAALREEAAQLLSLIAHGQIDVVQSAGWVSKEELSPWVRDLFRK